MDVGLPWEQILTVHQARHCRSKETTQGTCGLLWLESPRTLLSCIRNPAVAIDNKYSFRPTRVQPIRRVVEGINDAGHREVEPCATGLGYGLALLPILGLLENHVVRLVGIHLPAIRGVSLLDVHEEEGSSIPVLLKQCLEVAGPATKRWSGEAAENQHLRAVPLVLGSRDAVRSVEG